MADPAVKTRLALREIHGHVTVTKDTLTAWYVLAPQRWSFTTDVQREQLIVAFARRLTELAGYRCQIRVTARPYPARKWAETIHENSPHAIEGWSDHLDVTQAALHTYGLADKEVFFGVQIPRKHARTKRMRALAKGMAGARGEIVALDRPLRRITEVVGGAGMGGRPATLAEVEWLIHRSVRLCLPPPMNLSTSDDDWEHEDVSTFTDGVHYEYTKFGPTVQVSAVYGSKVITRHVAVLTIGRMGPLTIPQTSREPWMQHSERYGFPEWSSTFDIITGPEVRKQTERRRLLIRDQEGHYRGHGIDVPPDLARKAQQAIQIEDEITEGDPVTAARCYGWHRIAVSGRTEAECLERVQEIRDGYQTEQIDVVHPHAIIDGAAQYPLLTEFWPGEGVSTSAYKRRLKALHLAAALPHASATVGDRTGPYMGRTSGTSKRAFMWDPHHSMEVAEASGLVPIVGGLGAGKSGLIAKAVVEEVMRGIPTTVLDPSGPLANLCQAPVLRDHARHIDLVNGEDGVLNPWSVVPLPMRENYSEEADWRDAVKYAEQNRKMLAQDVCRMLLPPAVMALPQTEILLRDAIRSVGGGRDGDLHQVVKALSDHGDEHSNNVANLLRDMSDLPQSRLFFGNTARDREHITDTLLVVTMMGLQLPGDDQDRATWTAAEQMSVPLLHLGSWYTTARAYGLTMRERKMVALDEAGKVGKWGSGRALFNNLGRDTRKWNIAALVAGQNARDILHLDVANYISTAYVGRTEDYTAASDALRLLRIPADAGYEGILAGLSQHTVIAGQRARRGAREFIVKDVDGNVEKVRIMLDHLPWLLDAIETTPGQQIRGAA